MHHRIVECRVKLFAQAFDGGNAHLLKCGIELGHDHFHAFAVGFVLGALLQGALQIVVYRQKTGNRVCLDVAVQGVLLLLAALAEIVIFRTDTQIPIIQGSLFLLQGFNFFLLLGALEQTAFFLFALILGGRAVCVISINGFRCRLFFRLISARMANPTERRIYYGE